MRKLFAPFLAAVGLLVLLTGCGSPPLTGYAVELVKIERAADGTATATLRLVNPNVVSYNIADSVHIVTLDGIPAGTVKLSRPYGVPAQNTAVESGPFVPAPGYVLKLGTPSYRVDSTLTVILYGDSTEKKKLTTSGTTEIVAK